MISVTLQTLLDRIEGVKPQGDYQWQGCCPVHDDNTASLSIGFRDDKILMSCQAGCATQDVVKSIGLEMKDLFPPSQNGHSRNGKGGKIVNTYDYCDADGNLILQAVRMEPKDFRQRKPKDGGGWDWTVKGCKVVPYRLPELLKVDPADTVYIPEGEKDVDRLISLGLVATCNIGGAGKWRAAHSKCLAGRHVAILPDNDPAGGKHAQQVAKSLSGKAASIKVVELSGLPEKGDVSDWLDAGGTVEKLSSIVETSPEWEPKEKATGGSQLVTPPGVSGGSHNLTDYGNAERFVDQYYKEVRYCHEWSKWLAWDSRRWALDLTGAVERLAKKTVRKIYAEASNTDLDEDKVEAIVKWAKSSENTARVQALLTMAKSESAIPVSVDQLDARPWLLNVENGTIDLKTGELLPHRQSDYLTKMAPVEYPNEPGIDAVLWASFLDRIFDGDQNLIGFVQRLIGMALVGEVFEHILPIFYGSGANGKSVFIETICGLLGPGYGMKAASSLLIASNTDRHPTEVADLFGQRFVAVVETDDGKRLAEGLVKELTGGDTLRARRMREDFWQFQPSHSVFMATNHKPIVRGTGNAMWRRLRLVPFTVTIPDDEQDHNLTSNLRDEWPAILRWAVEGCLAWQRDGLGTAEAVKDATGEYQTDQDVLGGFLADECLIGATFRVKSTSLYAAYRRWAESGGEFIETQRQFGTHLSERGFRRLKSSGIWYRGVALREDRQS